VKPSADRILYLARVLLKALKDSRNLDADSLRRRISLKVASSNGNGLFRGCHR